MRISQTMGDERIVNAEAFELQANAQRHETTRHYLHFRYRRTERREDDRLKLLVQPDRR